MKMNKSVKKVFYIMMFCAFSLPCFAGDLGMCITPQAKQVVDCQLAPDSVLCVSTPPFGVVENFIHVKGTADLKEGLASLSMAIQHNYTGETKHLLAERCSGCPGEEGFCLDGEGAFCANVSLKDFGPYSALVTASFIDDAKTEKVGFSRVEPINYEEISVELSPDPNSNEIFMSTHLVANITLFDECQFCDFIGSSTGAIQINVRNSIKSPSKEKIVSCITNNEQGESGKFSIGVPIELGRNDVEIELCDLALDECKIIKQITWGDVNEKVGVDIINPPPQPSYSSSQYPEMSFEFKWKSALGECVRITPNFEEYLEDSEDGMVCPDSSGVYKTIINPQNGVNSVIVRKSGDMPEVWPWFFGWGNVQSPFDNESWKKDVIAGLSIPKNLVNSFVVPALNKYLNSSNFKETIGKIGSGKKSGKTETGPLPEGCSSSESSLEVKIIGNKIKLGSINLRNLSLNQDKMSFRLVVGKTSIPIDVSSNYGDIPLRIGWRKAAIDIILKHTKVGNKNYLELTGPHSDCDYREKPYCMNKPAIIIPANLIGDGKWGQFVHCDEKRRSVSGDAKELCHAVESLNAQTGLINDKILQAINDMAHCSGSGFLNKKIDISSYLSKDENDDIKELELPVIGSVKLDFPSMMVNISDLIKFKSTGIDIVPSLEIDNEKYKTLLGTRLHHSSVGVIEEPYKEFQPSGLSGGLTLQIINKLLFTMIALMDNGLGLDLTENSIYEDFGFDFVSECDLFEDTYAQEIADDPEFKKSAICLVRPRVQELLGSHLSTFGYFDQKQPLLVKARLGKSLPVHVSFGDEPDTLDIQIGGVTAELYPLKIDEALGKDDIGNLTALYDRNGKPIISDWTNDGSKPQIVDFGIGLFVRLEIKKVKAELQIKLKSSGTKLFLSPLYGTNMTTVPSALLADTALGKLSGAINGYSAEEKDPFKIVIGKEFNLPDPVSDWYLSIEKSKFEFKDGWIMLNDLDLLKK